MKHFFNYLQSVAIVISLLLLFSCSTNKKTTASQKSYNETEFVVFENDVLRDPVSGLTWTYYEDNPTTFFRYKLENKSANSSLPSMQQLMNILDKVTFQLDQRKDQGNIKLARWFDIDCYILTSKSFKTNEGEILYEVVRWNAAAKSFRNSSVTGGDLVTVLLVND